MKKVLPTDYFTKLELSEDLNVVLNANGIKKISEILVLTVGEWHLLEGFNYRHQIELIDVINKHGWKDFLLE